MATITKMEAWNQAQLNGSSVIDWDTDTIKVMLVDSTVTPLAATHDFIDDLDTNEVTGTNYTAGGATIASLAVTEASGIATVDGADVTWSQHASGFTDARFAVIYKDTGTPATSLIVGFIDFTSDKGNVNGDLTVQWNASGIFTQG